MKQVTYTATISITIEIQDNEDFDINLVPEVTNGTIVEQVILNQNLSTTEIG